MAKFAGLPWDLVMSAELFEHYKPDPETYLGAAQAAVPAAGAGDDGAPRTTTISRPRRNSA